MADNSLLWDMYASTDPCPSTGERKRYMSGREEAHISKCRDNEDMRSKREIFIERQGRVEIVLTRPPHNQRLLLRGAQECLVLERRWVQGPVKGLAIDLDNIDYDELDWTSIGPNQFNSLHWLCDVAVGYDALDMGLTNTSAYHSRRRDAHAHVYDVLVFLEGVRTYVCQSVHAALTQAIPALLSDVCDMVVAYLIRSTIPSARQYVMTTSSDPSAWRSSILLDGSTLLAAGDSCKKKRKHA